MNLSQNELAEASSVSKMTTARCYNLIQENESKIFPIEILEKLNSI